MARGGPGSSRRGSASCGALVTAPRPSRPTFGPPPSIEDLAQIEPEIYLLPAGSELWRIHFREGKYPALWNEFRFYGPIERNRFDHHTEPTRMQSRGVIYAAASIAVCLAEVFQRERNIDRGRDAPWLVAFRTVQALPLLDLMGIWPTRAGASQEIHTGDRALARAWSRAIYEAFPCLAGLWYRSKMLAGEPSLVLYERAADALPARPTYHEALQSVRLIDGLRNTAARIGYDLT